MPEIARLAGHSFLTAPLGAASVVVDLGVNRGEFAGAVIGRFGCRVVGVEPVPELFAGLPALPGLTVEQLAITGEGEPATLFVNPVRCATIAAELSEADATEVRVDGVTLAGLLDRHGLKRAALVKVDIEGAEVAMIERAADATLQRVDQFTIEFHDFLDPRLALPVTRAKRRLRSAGFAELALTRDNQDVLFVNTACVSFGPAQRVAAVIGHKYPRGIGRIVARQVAAARR